MSRLSTKLKCYQSNSARRQGSAQTKDTLWGRKKLWCCSCLYMVVVCSSPLHTGPIRHDCRSVCWQTCAVLDAVGWSDRHFHVRLTDLSIRRPMFQTSLSLQEMFDFQQCWIIRPGLFQPLYPAHQPLSALGWEIYMYPELFRLSLMHI